jgi:hypothetical protein
MLQQSSIARESLAKLLLLTWVSPIYPRAISKLWQAIDYLFVLRQIAETTRRCRMIFRPASPMVCEYSYNQPSEAG